MVTIVDHTFRMDIRSKLNNISVDICLQKKPLAPTSNFRKGISWLNTLFTSISNG